MLKWASDNFPLLAKLSVAALTFSELEISKLEIRSEHRCAAWVKVNLLNACYSLKGHIYLNLQLLAEAFLEPYQTSMVKFFQKLLTALSSS